MGACARAYPSVGSASLTTSEIQLATSASSRSRLLSAAAPETGQRREAGYANEEPTSRRTLGGLSRAARALIKTTLPEIKNVRPRQNRSPLHGTRRREENPGKSVQNGDEEKRHRSKSKKEKRGPPTKGRCAAEIQGWDMRDTQTHARAHVKAAKKETAAFPPAARR